MSGSNEASHAESVLSLPQSSWRCVGDSQPSVDSPIDDAIESIAQPVAGDDEWVARGLSLWKSRNVFLNLIILMCLRISLLCVSHLRFSHEIWPHQALVEMPDHGKQPGYKWRCKNFKYYNHAVNEEGFIYFAKSPCCFTILVNFVAKEGCTFRSGSGWHKGIFSEAKDGSFFCRFNCFGDEQDLKNHAHMRCAQILCLRSDDSMMYFLWVFCDI